MNWQVILRNQWFQLCLAAALCSAGAGIFDLATISSKNPLPSPSPTPFFRPTPQATVAPLPAFIPLHAKKAGHWIVDATGAGDSDSRGLYQVIGSAANGDTITIRAGSYDASVLINKDLTLVGEGTPPAIPLLYSNRDQSNVANVQAGHVTFSNLRIEQDFNASFAAIFCAKQAHVEIANCSVTSKAVYNVSAIDDAQLDVRDSLLKSSEIGYGIYYSARTHGSILRSNIAGNKWGLEVMNQAKVSVDSCTFQSNGDLKGYGVVVDVDGSGATLSIQRSNFLQNTAGIYAQESGNLSIAGCNLENNGITLEGDNVTSGMICVETAAQATLTNLVCKFNKEGISVWTGGKAQLNNVTLSNTGIATNNVNYQNFCNTVFLNGDGTTASISGSTISDSERNGIFAMNGAKLTLEKCSISNSKFYGLAFGSDDGTPGFGTVTDSNFIANHLLGIYVQAKSTVELNGGEINRNGINGMEVNGNGSSCIVTNAFVRNQKIGMMAYSGGSITAKRCTIEQNQIGIQAGITEKGREFGGTFVLESSLVQNNSGGGAASCAGSVINLMGNRFQNGRNDYIREAGGIIRNVSN